MERKIGEIFEYNGEWYQCVGGTCRNCSFYYDTVCKNITAVGRTTIGNCHCSLRTDHKSVIFKKLEKVGEPFYTGFYWSWVQKYKLYENNATGEYPKCHFGADYVLIEIKQTKEDLEEKKLNLKPFDRVLVRDLDFNIWYNDIFSFRDKDGRYMCIGNKWDECIPYNEQTAHLLGTTDNFEDNK